MLSMTFAGGTAPFAGILQLKGGESYIDFANSARISASCGSSRGDPAWDYMDPTSFDVNGGEYPSGNVTVMLRNVPATCVDLPLSKPCAVQPSAYKRPAMFRCKYTSATDPDDPDAEWSPWLHAQRNRVEYDGLATTEVRAATPSIDPLVSPSEPKPSCLLWLCAADLPHLPSAPLRPLCGAIGLQERRGSSFDQRHRLAWRAFALPDERGRLLRHLGRK